MGRLAVRTPVTPSGRYAATLPLWGRDRRERPGEIRARLSRHPLAELFAQHARAHLFDRAFGKVAELERTEGDADEPVDREPEVGEHVLHLAVLALANPEREPDIA